MATRLGPLSRSKGLLVVLAMFAAACGSTSSPGQSPNTSGSLDMGAIKTLISAGESGFLYNPNPDDNLLDPTSLVSLTPGQWKGPTSGPKAQPGAKVEVISCQKGSACDTVANGVIAAGTALSWQVNMTASDGTPAGDQKVFTAAISRHPNFIVAVALGSSIFGSLMNQAHSAGIKVIGVAQTQDQKGPPDKYDEVVSPPQVATAQIELFYAIGAANGKAHVALLWDTAYQQLVTAQQRIQELISKCSGCTLVDNVNRQYAAAADPVQTEQLVSSMIQRNGSNLTDILTPYGEGIPAAIAAIKSSAHPNIRISSKNGEAEEVAAVASGGLACDIAWSLDQTGWIAVDTLVHYQAGQPPLDITQEGLVFHIFVKGNAPADGNYDWVGSFPYPKMYKQAWGVA